MRRGRVAGVRLHGPGPVAYDRRCDDPGALRRDA